MQSVMSSGRRFSQVPEAEIQRSSFDRSHGYKSTFDAGYLIPVFLDEVLPGDTFNLRMSALARLATPLKPVMDNIFLESFFFFVPTRLVWEHWQAFNGERVTPDDTTEYTVPQILSPSGNGILSGSLSDYMGLPVGLGNQIYFNSLWHRAYNLIWNEWFRDQNLQDPAVVPLDDGPDTYSDFSLKKRGKRHDYFTSCLPWPQKGTAVSIPLGTSAPITARGIGGTQVGTLNPDIGTAVYPLYAPNGGGNVSTDGTPLGVNPMYADLSSATAATINSLRQAFQLQKLYERDARGGTRYTEILRAHFGVVSPDARLQRPEYLGGGSTQVNVTPVPQTSVAASTPQGNLAGFGVAGCSGHGFTKSFTEHGLLLGLVCVRADLTYQAGLDRMFSRRTRYDFYWPALSHIGEQAVLNKEIFCDGTTSDEDVFGYQERYAEYRYKPSKITGRFRSNCSVGVSSLDVWHLSQDFASLPVLDSTFISEDPPIGRVVAVPSEPHFLFDAYFNLTCARPMPVYGVPGMIDHF